DGELKILMGIRDQIRPGIKEELQNMKKLGVQNLVVLSGDNQGTVDLVASELGLTEAHGNMLPEDKSAYIEERQAEGQIIASDVVLMKSDFSHLTHALGLTKSISSNMIQNIVIAIGVVVILLAGLLFSDWMNMSIGMLAHELSIFVVILNGMRLMRYRV